MATSGDFSMATDNTPGARCCPPYWKFDQSRTVAPSCTVSDEICFYSREASGPFITSLTFDSFARGFLDSARRRGLAPNREIKTGRFKSERVYDLDGRISLGVDGTGYVTGPMGDRPLPLDLQCAVAPIGAHDQKYLYSQGPDRKRQSTDPVNSMKLLWSAHYALLELPLPREPRDFGP